MFSLRGAGSGLPGLYHMVCPTQLWIYTLRTQTAMETIQLNLSSAAPEVKIPGAWQTVQEELYPHLLNADS